MPSKPPTRHVASANDSSYVYSDLKRDQIRLVVLEPGDPSDPLVCRVLACHRNDAPPYEAVSYTRGDDDDDDDALTPTTVRVLPPVLAPSNPATTTALEIPRSSASALASLRHPDRARTLWIDALSINMSDISERSLQVPIMPQIYRSASRVVICLSGTSRGRHAAAMNFISRGRFKNAPPPATILAAVDSLFGHPWFSRTWAVQEVAASRSAVVVSCDGTSAPWSNFSLCARMLSLSVPVMSPIRRLGRRGWIDTLTADRFVKAMCEAAACHCRDPRDRVFAFLPMYPTTMNRSQIDEHRASGFSGVDRWCGGGGDGETTRGKGDDDDATDKAVGGAVADIVEDEKTRRARLTDYACPVRTVYTRFAMLLLDDVGLDLLSAVQGRSKTDPVPSWVPDWRANSGRTILAHLPLTEFDAGGHRGDQSFRIVPGDDGAAGKLEVSAICPGEIRQLGNVCDVNEDGWEDVVFRQWRGMVEDARRKRGSRECPSKMLSAFVQTIMTDSDDEYPEDRQMLFRRLSVVPENRSRMEGKSLFEGLDAEAITKLRISCHRRRLFIGPKGIMGLVASESEERDFVGILPGARIPYSFRHRHDAASADVELIGECFVQGFMRGEALVAGDSFVKREIRIC